MRDSMLSSGPLVAPAEVVGPEGESTVADIKQLRAEYLRLLEARQREA